MSEDDVTARDRAWFVVVDYLLDHRPIRTEDVVDGTAVDGYGDRSVHPHTARSVLRAAETKGYLLRHSEQAQTWYPDIPPMDRISDTMLRLHVEDLLDEQEGEPGDGS